MMKICEHWVKLELGIGNTVYDILQDGYIGGDEEYTAREYTKDIMLLINDWYRAKIKEEE